MKRYILAILVPAIAVRQNACGGGLAVPGTVLWLFGAVCVIYGFFGGPTATPGISWTTIGFGLLLWAIAAILAVLTLSGRLGGRCDVE